MVNWGNGASGAMTGAAAGTAAFGPVGGIVGGLVGGVAGFFGGKKKKRNKKPKLYNTLDENQKKLYGESMDALRGKGPFSDLYSFDAEGYNNVFDQTVGRPAYRNFKENIIPSITGQFRQGNLMNSSYTGDALSRAGRDVQESLDAQRSANIFSGQQQANQNKMAGINNLLSLQTFAMGKPQEKAPSTVDQILNSVGPAAGEWFADYIRNSGKNAGTATPVPPSTSTV